MQFKFLLALLFGALILTSVQGSSKEGSESQSGQDSGCSVDSNGSSSGDCAGDSTSREDAGSYGKSMESDEKHCEELTDGAEENDGECELIEGMNNMTESIEDEESKQIWIEFCAQLKLKISVKVDITIISSMFLEFQSKNPKVWDVVAFKNVTMTGFVLARYTKIVTYKQAETVSAVYTMDETDSCILIESFMNFSAGIDTLEGPARQFCDEELGPFLKNTTLSKRKRVIAISKLIAEFISRSTEYEAFWNLKIKGFGSLRSLYVLSQTYEQSRHVKHTISGDVETCELIVSLETRYQELIAEGNLQLAGQYQTIITQCKTEFASEMSFKGRLAIFIRIVRAQGRLNFSCLEDIYKCPLGEAGSVFDLICSSKQLLNFDLVKVTAPTTTQCQCSCN